MVQALALMAIVNPKISTTVIEGGAFQQEVEQRQVMAVPMVFQGGEMFDSGRMTLEQILARLDTGAARREAAKIAAKDPFDVLVVGGGPAGAAAAIYAARKGIRTGVAAERFGGQVLDTMAIENFISVPYTEGPKYAAALEAHVGNYEIDVIKSRVATELIPATEPGGLHTVRFGDDAALRAHEVIIATGAHWRLMGVPGEQEYRNKGITFCPHCDGPLFKGKDIAVIGGGNSGIEAAIDLAGLASHVTVLEFMPQCLADEVLMDKLNSMPNVDVITNAQTTEVLGDGEQVTGISYRDRASGETGQLALSGVFVQIGLVPNTDWLAGTLELSPRKEIVTDRRGLTAVEGIYAAGDCSTEPYKQIVVAQGSGAIAALSAWEHLIRQQTVLAS
ncbi:NADH dehydrogenase [bioreactor metagenome]|uniref:NADH dehydrogenase n=1 Tax=bioreactor metagenome TaxID=1076179 RepID=A0A645DEQ1_9ZZZZ